MTKKVYLFAAAAAAAVGAYAGGVEPVDWSSFAPGSTYTVPADTTNEVAAADYDIFTNRIQKVIFANGASTLRFLASTYPETLYVQGPGTLLMDERIVLDRQYTYLRRLYGDGAAGTANRTNFVKFVFAKGIDAATDDMVYFLRGNSHPFEGASIFIDGPMATNVQVYSAKDFKGRYDFGENFNFEHPVRIGDKLGVNIGVLRQRGGDIVQPNITGDGTSFGSGVGSHVSWLFEGGSYTVEDAGKYLCFYGNYTYFRQTGGLFAPGRFAVNSNASGDIRPDFVFGGTGEARIRGKSCPTRPPVFTFMDSVIFTHVYNSVGWYWENLSKSGHIIWAHNGGVAYYAFYPTWSTDTGNATSSPTNNFFAFNGGMRGFKSNYTSDSEQTRLSLFGWNPSVRIYENGGGILFDRSDASWTFKSFDFYEPEGNVVKSIALSDEVKNKVWQYPPAVEIYDPEGDGTNAAAIVDYDFDTGRITNILVVCKGENYSASTKANLRYKAGVENRLLTTPLDVVVGPEQGGDFIFATTNLGAQVHLRTMTNYTHGALIVDMDRLGVADHGKNANGFGNFLLLFYSKNPVNDSYFPNVTNIILKSGGLDSENGWGYCHNVPGYAILPKSWKIEMYGGHMTGGSLRFEDVTIGGEIWLRNHSEQTAREGDLRVCSSKSDNDDWQYYPGMVTLDVACLTNGVTPKIKYGNVRFYCGNANTTLPALAGKTNSVVTVKNWECIPKSRGWTTILDLSGTTVNVPSSSTVPTPLGHRVSTPDIVYPEGSEGELLIKWEMNPSDETKPYKLLARRISNGTMLIFR